MLHGRIAMLHGRIAMLHGRIAILHGRIAMRPYWSRTSTLCAPPSTMLTDDTSVRRAFC
jgi:hypothetical protein